MAGNQLYKIKTISEYHQLRGLPKPEHPLISLIDFDNIKRLPGNNPISLVFDFYSVAMKRSFNNGVKYSYGQQTYDFDEGTMFFMAPGQVFSVASDEEFTHKGWMLLVHPDFLCNTNSQKNKAVRVFRLFSA